MKLTCVECKNDIDLSPYKDLKVDDVVECNMCGITLLTTSIDGEDVTAEIVDEGK